MRRTRNHPDWIGPVDPAVRKVFETVRSQRLKWREFSEAVGYDDDAMERWRRGANIPRITAVRDMLNAVGLDLVVVEKSRGGSRERD